MVQYAGLLLYSVSPEQTYFGREVARKKVEITSNPFKTALQSARQELDLTEDQIHEIRRQLIQTRAYRDLEDGLYRQYLVCVSYHPQLGPLDLKIDPLSVEPIVLYNSPEISDKDIFLKKGISPENK